MAKKKIYKHHQRTTLALAQSDAQSREIVAGLDKRQLSYKWGDGKHQILTPHIDVKAFGAMGDGVTNDTSAIQSAIDTGFVNNTPIYFPAGTYLVTTITRVCDSANFLRLKGDGVNSSVIKKTGATTSPILDFSSTDTSPPPYLENFCEITDLKILGNANGHHGIQLTRMALCKLDRVNVVDCDYGVYNVGSLINNWTGCRFVANNRGFVVAKTSSGVSTVYSNVVNFTGCRFKGNYTYGIDIGGGNNINIAACEFDNNGTNADVTTGAVIIRANTDDEFGFGIINFDVNWFEGNKGRTFHAETGGGAFIAIKNSQFVGNETGGSARSIYVDGARGIYIDNICAAGADNTVEITANVSKSDVCNSTIQVLTDDCQNKNHFNINDGSGYAAGFSTDLFMSRSAKIKVAVSSTYGQEHQIYNDGSNRLVLETYNSADVRIPSNVQFADGAYNSGHPKLGNYHLWKDGNNELRMKSGAPGSAYDGWPLYQIRGDRVVALMANDSTGQVVIGSKPASANYAYSAKNDSEQSFTVATMVPKFIPVPNSTFTVSGVTYTVLKWDDTKVYVYEATSGAAASGTLTGVTCIPTFFRVLSNGRAEYLGATSGDNNVKINAPSGNYPILEFREDDASGTAWQMYKHPTSDDFYIWGGSEWVRIGRADGRLYYTTPNSAPTDGNLANSQITFYLDEGGNNLKVRVKYAGGTLKTGTIALV